MAVGRAKRMGNSDAFSVEEAAAVQSQLERILSSKLFRDTTRMKRFLRYITEQTLAGEAERLKGYTIGLEVFDRPDDFDPQADTIVRVQAGQLRRRLDLYYADEGEADPVRLTVPKGRYTPVFEFRTPVDNDAKNAPAMLQLLPTPERVLLRPGLAVITFDDLTDGGRGDFFAEGLTAEVVGALVQFRHLRVVTVRPTVVHSSGTMDVRDVGEQYDCQFVLSGNVRRAGDVFRVSVNLIATDTGRVMFSRTYDRQYTADNLFEIQESIASNVASSVAAPFGQINRYNWRRQKGRRNSISAYEAVLRFYGMGLSPRLELAQSLLADVESLTREHEDFSTGFAIRAMLHVLLCTHCIPCGDPRSNLDAAQELASRAIMLDSQNALAYFAAFQAFFHDGQVERATALGQRAMALNPNDYLMLAYFALTQANQGDVGLSEAYDEAARKIIGTPPRWFDSSRLVLLFRDSQFDEVLGQLEDVTERDSASIWFLKLSALGHNGAIEAGRDFFAAMNRGTNASLDDWIQTFRFWQPDATLDALFVEGCRKLGLDR